MAEIFGGVFGKKFLPRWYVEIGVIYFYQQLHGHQRIEQTFASLVRSAQAVWHFLEVISKRQIAFKSKAQADEKAQHTSEYVSILKRSATQLLDARWGFETSSTYPSPMQVKDIQLNGRLQRTPFPEISGDLRQFSRVPMPQRRVYKLLVIRRIAKKCLIRI